MPNSNPTAAKRKSKLSLILKILFVGGLLYFLSQKGFLSIQETRRALTQWHIMLPALLIMTLNLFIGAYRWHMLLKSQDIRLKWSRTLQLSLIGNFFNIALPGAVSGDFVKAFYVGKEIQGLRARAFGSILFDRVAGLSALSLVAAGALTYGLFFQSPWTSMLLKEIRFFVALSAFAVLVLFSYLFLVREHHDPVLQTLRSFERKIPKGTSLTRIYEGIRHYHNHRFTVIRVLAVSVIIHLLVGGVCWLFAKALGVSEISLISVYVVVPLGLLVTAIPVLPAGVGTGHAAFLALFKLLGIDRGADIYSLYAVIQILFGGIGGLVYLRFKSHEPDSLDLSKLAETAVQQSVT